MKRTYSNRHSPIRTMVENLERRMLLSVSQDVLIGALGAKAVTFTDADGTKATITVKGGGSATVHLSGDTLSQTSDKSGVTVSGTNVAVTGITGSRTVRGTILRVTAKGGNGTVSVGPVITDGALGTIDAKGVDLTGGITASGSITRITVNRITGGEVSVGDASTKLNLKVNSDASFDLSAPAVNSISVGGNLTDSTLTFTAPTTRGVVDLRNLSVGGAITSTKVDSEGSIGTISARKMVGSSVFAGVSIAPGKALPTSDAEFSSADSIGSVKLKKVAGTPSFINSDIAAHSLGTLNLGVVQLSNGGHPFGVASGKIGSASVVDDSTGTEVKLHDAQTQAEVDDAVSKDHVDLHDFQLNVVA
jgi:hypothetical protein